ncbi:MAG: MotA/TolQ/ExbB proton channel family protein [Candidatus Omnitrophota bacterium]
MRKRCIAGLAFIVLGAALFQPGASAGEEASDLKPYIESVEQAKEGLTLWQMIKTGGLIMVVLGFLSIAMVAFVSYNFMSLKTAIIAPREFSEEVIQRLEKGKENEARSMCRSEQNAIANIVLAGLDKKQKGHALAREAMENCVRKEIGDLWQNISYLSDIAVVAPLIGLLGTVLGMIQAFNVIAFQTAVVKPILLAGGVSKAMVTTAGGLIVAIPAMLFYTFFRARVIMISNVIETYSSDIIKIIEGSGS